MLGSAERGRRRRPGGVAAAQPAGRATSIDNLGGWLTTVLSRVCLNMLQARRSRPEVPLWTPTSTSRPTTRPTRSTRRCSPTRSGSRCWSCSTRWRRRSAWRSCCTTCSACRSRRSRRSWAAHRRPRASSPAARAAASGARTQAAEASRLRHAKLVDAFLAAARDGEFDRLLALLDPDVVLTRRPDGGADRRGRASSTGWPRSARSPATPAAPRRRCWTAPPRRLARGRRAAGRLPLHDQRRADHGIELIADPERLRALDLVIAGE